MTTVHYVGYYKILDNLLQGYSQDFTQACPESIIAMSKRCVHHEEHNCSCSVNLHKRSKLVVVVSAVVAVVEVAVTVLVVVVVAVVVE